MGFLLASTERTAQRPKQTWAWRCWWCHTLILKGERSLDQRVADGGSVCGVKAHPECVEACSRCDYYSDMDEPITSPQPRGKTQTEVEEAA